MLHYGVVFLVVSLVAAVLTAFVDMGHHAGAVSAVATSMSVVAVALIATSLLTRVDLGIRGFTDATAAPPLADPVRHPGHAARTKPRPWDLRAAAERVHAAVQPRFLSTVLVLCGTMAGLAAASVAILSPGAP